MPYIKEEDRQALTKSGPVFEFQHLIDMVISKIRETDIDDRDGLVNYAISRIVAGSLKPQTGWRYKNLSRASSAFYMAGTEFDRRCVAPYENMCIESNGDIPEYE